MLKSKLLWGFILGIATSVLLLEAKIHLGYSPWENRIARALAAPGVHLVTALNTPGTLLADWPRFLVALSFTCNLIVYVFFWYAFISIFGYRRSRQHPYDHDETLVPPITR